MSTHDRENIFFIQIINIYIKLFSFFSIQSFLNVIKYTTFSGGKGENDISTENDNTLNLAKPVFMESTKEFDYKHRIE